MLSQIYYTAGVMGARDSLPFLKKTRKWGVGETLSLRWQELQEEEKRETTPSTGNLNDLKSSVYYGGFMCSVSFSVPELILAFGWREEDTTLCTKWSLFSRRLIHRFQFELNSQPREDLTFFHWEKNLTVIHPHFLVTALPSLQPRSTGCWAEYSYPRMKLGGLW